MTDNLTLLRAELALRKLDAFVVPHADEYQNEYLPACNERLAWVSGFTGSAGQAVVTTTRAALFVDGRYTIQGAAQAPGFEQLHHINDSVDGWLAQALPGGGTVGYDPWLHTHEEAVRLGSTLQARGFSLHPQIPNPIDTVWHDRPASPVAPIISHPIEYAGLASGEKRASIANAIAVAGADALVMTDPGTIAWLLNVRGGDVPCTPMPLSRAIAGKDASLDWYVDPRKLNGFEEDGVRLHAEREFQAGFEALSGKSVLVDESASASAVVELLQKAGAKIVNAPDPCILARAQKNAAEQAGSRAAHARDALALVRFLAWLSRQEATSLTELDIVDKLGAFRAKHPMYRGPSFETIAGAGPNGAIVHYRATEASSRRLENGSFLLLDSGAQYQDGTTDITRTIAIGQPSDEMRDRFTRVLKGHIALATVKFPAGTTGRQLDVLARQFLWPLHLNYDHGTGHGVGSYLSVHEAPQRISAKAEPIPLLIGMIVSNEPGYYQAGDWGIRHENLLLVQSDKDTWNRFDTLSLVPFDVSAIDPLMLTHDELDWLNAYHAKVCEIVSPQLDQADRAWLQNATMPITMPD